MKLMRTTIGEHCNITSSKRFHASERSKSGIPFYCSKEIISKVNGEVISECDYIREDLYEKVKEEFGVPETGDLLLTSRGTYGVPYIYRETDKFYFADGNLTWFKDFDNQLCARYFYYWILSHEGKKKLDSIAKGTAQKALPIVTLKSLEIDLPVLGIQKQIVEILSAYDNLIENNQKQIKLLEEAAQRLYKEWFVDLRFPGHEDTEIVDSVPVGWNYSPLKELIGYEIGGGWGEETVKGKNEFEAYVIRGTDFSGLENGNILSIPLRYHTESNLNARTLQPGDIVFEVSGGSRTEGVARTVMIKQALLERYGKPVICASFCKLVRPVRKEFSQYLFDHFRYLRESKITEEFDKRSASSIVNYRWKDFLSQRYILIPSDDILFRYNSLAERIFDKKANLSLQIETLKSARDRLLPKLMSGEIEL